MSCAQCFEDIGIFAQNASEQNKSISQLVDQRKSLSDRVVMQKKRKANLQKISLKKLQNFSSNFPMPPNTIKIHQSVDKNAYKVHEINQLVEKVNSKPPTQIKIVFSQISRATTQIPQTLYLATHHPISNHKYKVHLNYNLPPQRNIMHAFPLQNKEVEKYDNNLAKPLKKANNTHQPQKQDAFNVKVTPTVRKHIKEGIQQLKDSQQISSEIQKKISEQFQKDLQQVMLHSMIKIQPHNISHKSKSLIIQNEPYLKPPEINQDMWSSRISRTLSGTRNIQEIMCTKTQSVGSSSSSSQFSQIILKASHHINNEFKLRNSSTTFNIVEPAPEPSTPTLPALFSSDKTKKTKAKALMTKRSFSDK